MNKERIEDMSARRVLLDITALVRASDYLRPTENQDVAEWMNAAVRILLWAAELILANDVENIDPASSSNNILDEELGEF